MLCALALGRPSGSRSHLALDYLEANPSPDHPLKGRVTATVLEAAGHYARITGCLKLRLNDPDPALIAWYESFGFRLVRPRRGRAYLEKELRDE